MQSIESFKRSYLIGAIIVWASIIVGVAVILAGTPYFAQVLPPVGGGAIWFVVIISSVLQGAR